MPTLQRNHGCPERRRRRRFQEARRAGQRIPEFQEARRARPGEARGEEARDPEAAQIQKSRGRGKGRGRGQAD